MATILLSSCQLPFVRALWFDLVKESNKPPKRELMRQVHIVGPMHEQTSSPGADGKLD